MNRQRGVSYVEALCCLALVGMSTVAVFEGAEAYTEKANDYIASQKQMPKMVQEHLYKKMAESSQGSLDKTDAEKVVRLAECMSSTGE
jgi:hypothetical protein